MQTHGCGDQNVRLTAVDGPYGPRLWAPIVKSVPARIKPSQHAGAGTGSVSTAPAARQRRLHSAAVPCMPVPFWADTAGLCVLNRARRQS